MTRFAEVDLGPEAGWVPADPLSALSSKDNFVRTRDPDRIRLEYYRVPGETPMYAKVIFGPGAKGPPNHVHGGALMAVLDGQLAHLGDIDAVFTELWAGNEAYGTTDFIDAIIDVAGDPLAAEPVTRALFSGATAQDWQAWMIAAGVDVHLVPYEAGTGEPPPLKGNVQRELVEGTWMLLTPGKADR